LKSEFTELNAKVVGISPDSVNRQRQFDEEHTLDFPLLSDAGGGSVASLFGVKRLRRCSFVIGQDRRVIHAFRSEINMTAHADKALAALRESPA